MKKQDYFLKCVLLESLGDIGVNFVNKETGKSENNDIIKELLKDEQIKDRLYLALEDELTKVLKEKYGI
ncbi:hypothetical protein [Fusobacterium sp.]|uniref:hypothetical protein n=1 Tax=Fusobacterium sp. TaxID=68766 RepID=UPI002E7A1005|nr:hypothetical protein [Fusobacterium sp.]MEE1475749.1 hypothetical protein [Fusobacterium sp.]